MKHTIVAIAFLLIVPTLIAAQIQTRERRSNDNQTTQTEGTGVRDRVVGQRVANHAQGQKAATDPRSRATSEAQGQAQDNAQPSWGNTSIIVRPSQPTGEGPRVLTSPNKTIAPGSEPNEQKLAQLTSLSTPNVGIDGSLGSNATRSTEPSSSYHVGIGDVLDVRLLNVSTRESTLYTVLKNGTVEHPLLSGPISVAGLTPDEIGKLLSTQIRVIKSARVSVTVRDYASHAVLVTGLVDSPGRKILRRDALPLYAVLAEALTRPEATTVVVVRNGKEGDPLDLKDKSAMSTLVLSGDIIKISGSQNTATRVVYVGGEVAAPGEKTFREGMTLTQAVLCAGGAARTDRITIKIGRRSADGFLTTNQYDLRSIEAGKAPDPLLQSGDRIEVTRNN